MGWRKILGGRGLSSVIRGVGRRRVTFQGGVRGAREETQGPEALRALQEAPRCSAAFEVLRDSQNASLS